MHRVKLIQVALLALPLVALGCGRQRADTRETTAEVSPLPGHGAATAIELGSKVGGDGRLEGHSDTFKRGEPIIASIDATALKAGASVRLTWMGPQGQVVANDEIVVPPDARLITFKAQETSAWAPGSYRLDFNDAGALTGSKTFSIE